MSYTVLARRYRSNTFDEVIGQEHIAQTLKKAIESDRIAHAYLFCGTRGTGKTSTARILAKALNCRAAEGPTTQPCGQCDSCQAIARGEDMDVVEIDAASNTGVDNVRGIIENAQYRPAHSRFKVYIIDEVHMLSKSAFNALLKTLEEPPSHVKFILATTEPEKVLATILSRCQRYDFRNIPTREIAGHLKAICTQEKINADEAALLMVAKAGAGSMRDSLSLLDRLLSIGETQLTTERIEQLLGLPKSELIFNLAQAIGQGDVKATLTQADALVQSGLAVDTLVASLVDHLRNLLILGTCGPDTTLVDVPGLSIQELAAQAKQFDPVALTQDITILEELRRQIRQSQAGRALLDATLVRMALADQFNSIADLLGRIGSGDGAGAAPIAQKKKPELSSPGPSAPVLSPAPAARAIAPATPAPPVVSAPPPTAPPAVSPPSPSIDLDDNDDLPAVGRVWDGPTRSLSSILAAQKAQAAKPAGRVPHPSPAASSPADLSNIEPVDPADLPAVWQALLALLAEKGPGLHGMLSYGRFIGVEEGRAIIRFAPQQETFVKMLDRNGKKDLIRENLSALLKDAVGVSFEVDPALADAPPPPVAPSPASPGAARAPHPDAPAAPAQPTVRLTAELKAELESDELIRALIAELGGNIVKVE
jgi:DNA polymerase-3 subunit gamma/tau